MLPLRDTIPHRNLPVMTWVLIGANLAVFALELSLEPTRLNEFFALCGLLPARYTDGLFAARHNLPEGDWWPFVTSLFLHGGWLHMGANLWTLYIFGDNVEDRLGPLRFLVFYLACGVAAGALHVLSSPASSLPTVGASGAVAGVMGAYFVSFPRARILTLIPVFCWPVFVELPALLYMGLWFALQFVGAAAVLGGNRDAGGVAWWAHVGGFLTGIGLLYLLLPAHSRGPRAPQLDLP